MKNITIVLNDVTLLRIITNYIVHIFKIIKLTMQKVYLCY